MLNVLTLDEQILVKRAFDHHSNLHESDEITAEEFAFSSGLYEFCHNQISESEFADRLTKAKF